MSKLELQGAGLGRLGRLSLELEGGVWFVLGGPSAGTIDWTHLLCGATPPEQGSVLLDGVPPHRTPELRRQVGALLPEAVPTLPAPVADWLREMRALRGEATPLRTSGSQAVRGQANSGKQQRFEGRTLDSLSPAEAAEVGLELALSHPKPKLVLLFEPFRSGVSAERLAADLKEAEARGALVVVVSASLETFDSLSQLGLVSQLIVLKNGYVMDESFAEERLPHGRATSFSVLSSDPRKLLGELQGAPDVTRICWDGASAAQPLFLEGVSVESTSAALLTAIVSSQVEVYSVERCAFPAPVAGGRRV